MAEWKVEIGKATQVNVLSGNGHECCLQRTNSKGIEWIQKVLQRRTFRSEKGDIRTGNIYAIECKDDNHFYRGRVDKIEKSKKFSGNEYVVTLVDFADHYETVPNAKIFELPEDLLSIPPQSFNCQIRNLIMPAADRNYKVIEETLLIGKYFRKLFSVSKQAYVVFHPTGLRSGPRYEVDISRSLDLLNEFIKDNIEEYDEVPKEAIKQSKEKVKDWLVRNLNVIAEPTKVFSVPSISLKEDSDCFVECVMEHIVSPELFYLHLLDEKYEGKELIELSAKLTQAILSKDKITNVTYEVGQYVAVEEDGEWLRGQVQNCSQFIEVFLIDYGEIVFANLSQVQPLPLEFANLHKFALPCKLDGIKPIEGSKFSKEACDFFKEICQDPIGYKFKHGSNTNLPLSIVLYRDHSTLTVNQEMIENNFALSHGVEWDPMTSDFISPQFKQLDEEQHQQDQDDKKMCKFYRFSGKCPQGRNCPRIHIQTGSEFYMKDEECPMVVAHNELELPAEGEEISVHIPTVRHPNNFYVNILDNGICHEDLAQLNEEMTTFYRNDTTGAENSQRPFVPGEIVAAKYLDERWYRARIIDLLEDVELDNDMSAIEKVRLFFVDYGQCHTIDVLCIRKMKLRFLTLPFQALECSLGNVAVPSDEVTWSKMARQEFRRLTNVKLKAKVLSNLGPSLEVTLSTEEDGDLGDKLVSMNLARPVSFKSQRVVVFPG